MTEAKTATKLAGSDLSLSDQIMIWFEKNFAVTVGILVGIVTLTLGWIVYQKVSVSMERSGFTKVDELTAIYHRPVGAEGGGFATLEELQKNAQAGADAKRFETRKARAEALIQKAGPEKAPKASGPELVLGFYRGFAQSDAGNQEAAEKTFQQVEAAKPVWAPVARLAAYNRAAALSEAGKFEEAATAFRAASRDATDDILRNQSLLQAAYNYRAAGNVAESLSVLEQLREIDATYAEQNGAPLMIDELNSAKK